MTEPAGAAAEKGRLTARTYRALAGCLSVGCAIFAALTVWIGVDQRSRIAEKNTWPETTGTVTRVWTETYTRGAGEDETTVEERYAAFAFNAGGRRIEARERVTPSMDKAAGDMIQIRYSPQQPEYARIEGVLDSKYGTTIFLGVAAVFAAAVCVTYLIVTRKR